MALFSKRPETVEAIQWTGDNTADVTKWLSVNTAWSEAVLEQMWDSGHSGSRSLGSLRPEQSCRSSTKKLWENPIVSGVLANAHLGDGHKIVLYEHDWLVLTPDRLDRMGNHRFQQTYVVA